MKQRSMDPDETLKMLVDALNDSDAEGYREAIEHAQTLLEWLHKGGFEPEVKPGQLQTLVLHLLHLAPQWLEECSWNTPFGGDEEDDR